MSKATQKKELCKCGKFKRCKDRAYKEKKTEWDMEKYVPQGRKCEREALECKIAKEAYKTQLKLKKEEKRARDLDQKRFEAFKINVKIYGLKTASISPTASLRFRTRN